MPLLLDILHLGNFKGVINLSSLLSLCSLSFSPHYLQRTLKVQVIPLGKDQPPSKRKHTQTLIDRTEAATYRSPSPMTLYSPYMVASQVAFNG